MIDGRRIDVRWPDGVRWRRKYRTEEAAARVYQVWAVSTADGSWRRARARLERVASKTVRFDQLKDRYMAEYVKPRSRDVKTKQSRFNSLSAHFGKMRIGRIRPRDIGSYLAKRQKAVSNKTVNEDLVLLKHCFSWAIDQELMTKNPAARFSKLPVSKSRKESRPRVRVKRDDSGKVIERRSYTVERPRRITTAHINEMMASLADVNPAQFPVFVFIRETGCRLNEALSVQWSGVDAEDGVIYLDQSKTDDEKVVPLTDGIKEILEAVPVLPGCPFVFYNSETGTRWKDVRKAWLKARKLAGLEWIEIHDLRRYRATELWEQGIPPQDVAEFLGHASVSTTEKHYIQQRRREAAKEIGRRLRKVN